MTVRAKFYVQSVTDYGEQAGKAVELRPVSGGSEENKAFWAATPNGELKMTILNEAAKEFVPGKCAYLDFTMLDEYWPPK